MEVLCVGTEKGVVEVYSVEIAGSDEDSEDDEDDEENSESSPKGADVERVGTLVGHTNR
jgi:hypothetical protein